MSTAYLTQAAGKRSVEIDLESEAGLAAMHELLSKADVLVENHRPSTLERLGLSDETIAERHPHLIHCAMTGYGRGHALQDAPAYDVNIQAASGLMSLTGTAESGPTRIGAPVIDYATALAAGMGICAALVSRGRIGIGGLVDVSMMDTAFTLMSSTIVDCALTGHKPKRRGNEANSRSPSSGTFHCAEGQLSLGVNEVAQFERLAIALDCRGWLRDDRFATVAARDANREVLAVAIEDVLSTDTAENWEMRLLGAGVPAARVAELPEAIERSKMHGRPFLSAGQSTPWLPMRLGTTMEPSEPEALGASNAILATVVER
jgi:crotonobetainyl-CoA:carnitine CoA-transferase CaiB-like acyl-CoA transferase